MQDRYRFTEMTAAEQIHRWKAEKNAVILAHYYVRPEIQEIADYVGDSYFLSEKAAELDAEIIVLCGVSFMGESAKILNTDKRVLLPEPEADCPMAHMATPEQVAEVRAGYDDLAVVCYVNSTAELKAVSDVCVTSSNAQKIVKALPQKNIFFIPDQNLAHFIAGQLPEKNFIFHTGYCPVHHDVRAEDIAEAKAEHPEALVLVHPECRPEVVSFADYAGSTAGILKFASESSCDSFIIGTEQGIFYQLKKRNPEKKFYPVGGGQICPGMKEITLEKVLRALEREKPEVEMEDRLSAASRRSLLRMLELSR